MNSEAQKNQMIFCKMCGRKIHISAVSCPGCGVNTDSGVNAAKISGSVGWDVSALILSLLAFGASWDIRMAPRNPENSEIEDALCICAMISIILAIIGFLLKGRGRMMRWFAIWISIISMINHEQIKTTDSSSSTH